MATPMVEMSRAIRRVIEDHTDDRRGPGLAGLSDEALEQFVPLVGAFYGDLRDEMENRTGRAA